MASTVSSLTSGSASTESITTASVSPGADSLVLAVGLVVNEGGAVPGALTVSGDPCASWSSTQVGDTFSDGFSFQGRLDVWQGIADDTGTITFDWAGTNHSRYAYRVIEVTEVDTTTPVKSNKGSGATGTTGVTSLTLGSGDGWSTSDGDPDPVIVIGGAGTNDEAISIDGSYTELGDVHTGAFDEWSLEVGYLIGSAEASPQIDVTNASQMGCIALEINNDPGTTDLDIPIPLGTVTVTGYAPTASAPETIAIPLGSATITGYAPTVLAPETIPVRLAGVTVTGYEPTVIAPETLEVPAGSVLVTGYEPTVLAPETIEVVSAQDGILCSPWLRRLQDVH